MVVVRSVREKDGVVAEWIQGAVDIDTEVDTGPSQRNTGSGESTQSFIHPLRVPSQTGVSDLTQYHRH